MAIANSNFRVRNGIYVAGNSSLVGNTVITGNLTTNGTFVANGSNHEIKANTNLGASTLHVNGVNKRVVVNASATSTATDTTDWAFEVKGKTNLTNKVFLGDTLAVNGNVTVGNSSVVANVTMSGAASVGGTLTVTGNAAFTGNNFSFGNSSVTTPYTVIYGDLKVTGKYVSDSDNKYDLDDLSTAVGAIPIIKVYDVNGTKLFP